LKGVKGIGLLGKVAGCMRDCDVNTNGDSIGIGGGDQVMLWVIGNVVFQFPLDIAFGMGEADEGCMEQKDSVEGVTNVILERWFTFF
jgi:hypothetical protein